MKSAYFKEFLVQLNASGHLKADGYDLSLFQKLSNSELKEAEDLLIDAIHRGDWNGIDALCQIGSKKSLQSLNEVFVKISPNRFLKFKLATYLYDKTQDESYSNYLTPKFANYDDSDKLNFIRFVPKLSNAKDYFKTLFSAALSERSKVVRFYSGLSVLQTEGFIDSDNDIENYRPLLKKLADEDEDSRAEGLVEINKLISKA